MAINNQRDFAAGLTFTVIGIGFALGSRQYPMGSAAGMGPGYFPALLGGVLAILGVLVAMQALAGQQENHRIGAIAWRPLLLIIGANLLFGICLVGIPAIGLPPLGLAVGIAALVLVASLASREFQWRATLVLVAVLAAASYVTFIKLLSQPFDMWPAFIAG